MRITIPDRYPVTVPADSPVLCGLSPVLCGLTYAVPYRMKLLLQGSVYDHAYVVHCPQEFHEARDDILGRRNVRTANDGKAAFEMDPPPLPLLETMREYGDHLNTPRLGHHRNFDGFSQQNNVASAQHPSEEHKFSDHQGFFRGVHKDKGDAGNGPIIVTPAMLAMLL
ncbi:hypothetical protein BC629DRAFT_1598055 [Irpex lacteus]|nr:hypothetical protein BC629DRAFT_1598055 [Irpex lacteus]